MLIVSIIVMQVIIFAALIYFFRRILTKNVVSATKHIDELNREYDKREKEAAKKLDEANKKYTEIVSKASNDARKKADEILKNAEKQRDNLVRQARSQSSDIMHQADISRERFLAEMDQRVAKAAVDKAAELIQSSLPEEIKSAAHEQWVRDLIEKGFEEIGEVKVVEGVKEIKVTTAFPLKESDRAALLKKINKLIGRDIEFKEEVDPKIVAGISIQIGSLILDGSLRNRIQERSITLANAERGADGQ